MSMMGKRIRELLEIFKERRLKREDYDRKFSITLRKWLLAHQRDIVFDKMTWIDVWIYQEILYEVRPDVVIEIGSAYGGSTRYLADLLDLLQNGIVVSIDIDRSRYQLTHHRVVELTGDSSDPSVLSRVQEICLNKKTIVIQDGGHTRAQVLRDLEDYSPFVSLSSYFIVEDGIVDLFNPGDGIGFEEDGPLAAIEEFLSKNPQFQVDSSRERYILTYNPKGFLKRVGF
jgi:cephalosporin hydroxylase